MTLLPLLFGDETRLAVLKALHQAPSGLSQRELARQVGRNPAHVHRVLQALDALGVLDAHSNPRSVTLVRDHPLYEAVTRTIDWFDRLELQTPLLRFVVRAAKQRFGDRCFIGGYQAVVSVIQPIDFRSDRVDLYVKRPVAKDRQWAKQLDRATTFDVRLHEAGRFDMIRQGTLDAETCWMARAELAVVQCLEDEGFLRYGAYLMLVQGIQEGALDPDMMNRVAQGTRYQSIIRNVVDRVHGRIDTLTDELRPEETKALRDALETMEGERR